MTVYLRHGCNVSPKGVDIVARLSYNCSLHFISDTSLKPDSPVSASCRRCCCSSRHFLYSATFSKDARYPCLSQLPTGKYPNLKLSQRQFPQYREMKMSPPRGCFSDRRDLTTILVEPSYHMTHCYTGNSRRQK